MLYTIVEPFGPNHDGWNSYLEWRGIPFQKFDSLDGILSPSLLGDPSDKDWDYLVAENFMGHLITELAYAKKKHRALGKGRLIGLNCDRHDTNASNFLGFEILDHYWNVSLLTNFGNDIEMVNENIRSNGLLSDEKPAQEIAASLKEQFPDDAHTRTCQVISVYHIQV